MVTEDDTRGNGGTVTLYLSVSTGARRYLVDVASGEGKKIGTIAADTPAEAYACRLSFACPDVPDIFSSAVT